MDSFQIGLNFFLLHSYQSVEQSLGCIELSIIDKKILRNPFKDIFTSPIHGDCACIHPIKQLLCNMPLLVAYIFKTQRKGSLGKASKFAFCRASVRFVSFVFF